MEPLMMCRYRLRSDALAAGSYGTVQLSAGNFYLATTVVIKAGVTLKGVGSATVINAVNGLNDDLISGPGTADVYNCAIKDMRIDGNKANQNAGDGVVFTGLRNFFIENVGITDCYRYGIYANGYTHNSDVPHILHTTVGACGTDGIRLSAVFAFQIIGGYYNQHGGNGITLEACGEGELLGVMTDENTGCGIYGYTLLRTMVSGSGYLGYATNYGVQLTHSSTLNTVIGNYIADNYGAGVYIDDGSTGNIVTANTFYNNTGGNIIAIANNQIHGNQGYIAPGEHAPQESTIMVYASDAPNLPSDNVEGVYYVCDGTADDVQINAAIAAVVALGGGKVTLSAGTFNLSDSLAWAANYMTLEGQGYSTILYLAAGVDKDVITITAPGAQDSAYYNTLRDFKIDGRKASNSAGHGINALLYNGTIERVWVRQTAEDAIRLGDGVNNMVGQRLSNLIIHNAGGYGIYMREGSADSKILRSTVYASGKSGIAIEAGSVTVLGCHSTSNTEHGLTVGVSVGGIARLIAVGSHFMGNHKNGLYVYGASSFTINSNQFWTNDVDVTGLYSDIYFAGASPLYMQNGSIVSNVFNGDSTSTYNIYFGENPATHTRLVIKDNVFNNAVSGAIYEAATSTTNIIEGNVNYIAPGEHREASGTLTAGNANAFAFAWQNPEAQPIWAQVMVEITTAGGTAGSLLDVGSAADGTTHSDNLIDGADLNATNLLTTSAWVKLAANGGATDYITGQILSENAASLVGKYYVRYFGV